MYTCTHTYHGTFKKINCYYCRISYNTSPTYTSRPFIFSMNSQQFINVILGEWTLTITSQSITASAGVSVTQGTLDAAVTATCLATYATETLCKEATTCWWNVASDETNKCEAAVTHFGLPADFDKYTLEYYTTTEKRWRARAFDGSGTLLVDRDLVSIEKIGFDIDDVVVPSCDAYYCSSPSPSPYFDPCFDPKTMVRLNHS